MSSLVVRVIAKMSYFSARKARRSSLKVFAFQLCHQFLDC